MQIAWLIFLQLFCFLMESALMLTCTEHADDCENEATEAECRLLFTNGTNANDTPVQCNNPELRELAIKCAKICKMCCRRPKWNCENPTQNNGFKCDSNDCLDEQLRPLMVKFCPYTCGFCALQEDTGCRDLSSKCSQMEYLCTDESTKEHMSVICRKTCKICTDGTNNYNRNTNMNTVQGNCMDTSTNCDRNICSNRFWKSMMEIKCKRTCGLC